MGAVFAVFLAALATAAQRGPTRQGERFRNPYAWPSLSELVELSETIVAGEVLDMRSSWTADRRQIFTTVTLRTDRRLKGGGGALIRFRIPGGTVGDTRLRVTHSPQFAVGERALVFLAGESGRLPRVVAGEAGETASPRRGRRCGADPAGLPTVAGERGPGARVSARWTIWRPPCPGSWRRSRGEGDSVKSPRRFRAAGALALLVAGGCGGGGEEAATPRFLSLGAAPPGGAFFVVGGALAEVLGEAGMRVTAEATKGSGENIRRLASGELDLALSNAAVTYFAARGEDGWGREYPVQAVMTLAPNVATFVSPAATK